MKIEVFGPGCAKCKTTAENARQAIEQVHPAALDIASGAELSPGIKDFDKVAALLRSITDSSNS